MSRKKDEELSQEELLERIRRKRARVGQADDIRKYLNIAFLVLAGIGLVWYYTTDTHKIPALAVIGVGMVLKIVEFVLRFI